MSSADLLQAVRQEREIHTSGGTSVRSTAGSRPRGTSETDLLRRPSRLSTGRSLRSVGSHASSTPLLQRRLQVPMTFEAMQEHVYKSAMERFIGDLEREAKEAVDTNAEMQEKIKQGLEIEKVEKLKQRELALKNAREVREQIEENKGRRADIRRNHIEAASAHSFPLFTETFIDQDEVEQYRKEQKVAFRAELDRQRETQAVLKNVLVKKDRDNAASDLQHNLLSMSEDREAERKRRLQQGAEMMRVWDRDIKFKEIRKAILTGKDVERHVASPGRMGKRR